MLSHGIRDKTQQCDILESHRKTPWQHADLEGHAQSHAAFFLGSSGQRRLQAVPSYSGKSLPEKNTVRSRGLSKSETSANCEFRNLTLTSTDSHDGNAEQSARCISRAPTNPFWGPRGNDASLWITNTGWNVSKLLDLSDTVRAALHKGRKLTYIDLGDLTFVLSMMITDELADTTRSKTIAETQKIAFQAIQHARLDKLLADMLLASQEKSADVISKDVAEATGLRPEITNARNLQGYWRARFKSDYLPIDRRRYDSIAKDLREAWFPSTVGEKGDTRLHEAIGLSEADGTTHFVPGQWWFNLDCARHDGIVTDITEKLTQSRYGNAVLPLMTGFEEELPDGQTEYIRRGNQRDMHYAVLSQVGRKTKLLRGFRLKSIYAPDAGVRYDGLYNITCWSIKLCACTDMWSLRITLDRLPGQYPMREILKIPRPSQLDDWGLYEELERSVIQERDGNGKFMDWTAQEEKERAERDYWHQMWALQGRDRDIEPDTEAEGSEQPSPLGSPRLQGNI